MTWILDLLTEHRTALLLFFSAGIGYLCGRIDRRAGWAGFERGYDRGLQHGYESGKEEGLVTGWERCSGEDDYDTAKARLAYYDTEEGHEER